MNSNKLNTVIQFVKNIRTTGAVSQSSRKVEIEICRHIKDDKNLIFVEFGLGHGNITKEILSRMNDSSQLFSFEVNAEFCEEVSNQIEDSRLTIINDSAENFKKYVADPIDGIVSSIPLTIIPKKVRDEILQISRDNLKEKGFFSQLLYSKRMNKTFAEYFDQVEFKRIANFPIAFIHHCLKN